MSGASMNQIRSRIKSVGSTMQITRAMELVATSKLRRARERAERSRPFLDIAQRAIRSALLLEDAASSCESAVLMDAATMAEIKIPPMNASAPKEKMPRTTSTNTRSLVSATALPRYSCATKPRTDAIIRMMNVQVEPTIWDFFISFLSLIAMYLTRICGIPA